MIDASSIVGHRWGAGLRKIGQHLIEQLGIDNSTKYNNNSSNSGSSSGGDGDPTSPAKIRP